MTCIVNCLREHKVAGGSYTERGALVQGAQQTHYHHQSTGSRPCWIIILVDPRSRSDFLASLCGSKLFSPQIPIRKIRTPMFLLLDPESAFFALIWIPFDCIWNWSQTFFAPRSRFRYVFLAPGSRWVFFSQR